MGFRSRAGLLARGLAQASFALAVPGAPGRFLLMADRWNPERLGVSRRGPATLLP